MRIGTTIMPIDLQATTASLLAFPPRDRLRIGETLIERVGGLVDDDVAESWNAVIERRVAELKTGAVCGIPAEDVFAEIEARLATRKSAAS